MTRTFDLNGNQTRLTYPDGYYVTYGYDAANELSSLTDSSGVVLLQISYDNLGRRTSISRASGPSTTYTYGANLYLSNLAHSFATSSKNVTFTYGYDLAGEIITGSPSNSLYSWSNPGASQTYTVDGQNKYTAVGSSTLSYDARANLSFDTTMGHTFDGNDKLVMSNMGASVYKFDGEGRIASDTESGSPPPYFLYDGAQLVIEYNSSDVVAQRYIPGVGLDEPLVWYSGSGTTASTAQWPLMDGEGNVVAAGTTGVSNTTVGINTFDPFGVGGSGNFGRFQFKGMPWMPGSASYQARARDYNPLLGRFLQPDPKGYGDGMNFYNFAHSDPVTGSDPSGECGSFATYTPDYDDAGEDIGGEIDLNIGGPCIGQLSGNPLYINVQSAPSFSGSSLIETPDHFQRMLGLGGPHNTNCSGFQRAVVSAGEAVANAGSAIIGFSEKTGLLSLAAVGAGVEFLNPGLTATGLAGSAASVVGLEFGGDGVFLGHFAQFAVAPSVASASNFARGVIEDAVVKPLPLSPLTKQMLSDAIDKGQPPEGATCGG